MGIRVPPGEPLKSPLGALLGRSWSALGRSWGRLGALLGPSWGPVGPSWSHLEASRADRTRKGEDAKNIEKHKGFEGFWPLGCLLGGLERHLEPSWGGLESSWMHVESYIEPSWAILHDLGSHLGLSGALLEPSWAILDALTPRGAPRPGPGEGVRGKG